MGVVMGVAKTLLYFYFLGTTLLDGGLEMACVIREFENFDERRKTDTHHHEQTKHAQMAFAQDVKALAETIEDIGNPFSEIGSDLRQRPSRPSSH